MFGNALRKKKWARIGSALLSVAFLATGFSVGMPLRSFAEESNDGGNGTPATNESSTTDRNFDEGKIDVWDFGAENLGEGYNNRLDVDTINGFFNAEPGTTGVTLASFSVDNGDFIFNDGGYSTNHRLRTSNTALTRTDEKSLKDSDGNVYTGYIYSNKGSNANVYVALNCRADDTVTFYVASNGTDSELHFENMSDASDSNVHTHTLGSGTVSKMVVYPKATAQYKLYSATEKLVVARVYRQHASYANISGTVTGFTGAGTFDLVFTNRQNGNVVRSTVSEGNFTATLAKGFDYDMTLEGADAYVITSEKSVNASEDGSLAVTVSGVSLVNVSGTVSGIESGDLNSFKGNASFTFTPDDHESVYVPAMELSEGENGLNFSVTLQSGVNYALTLSGADDYTLGTTSMSFDDNSNEATIALTKKDVYSVNIAKEGTNLEALDLSGCGFKFILLDPSNGFTDTTYSYTFTGTEGISLRNGRYRVEVTGVPEGYSFEEKYSKDAKVSSEEITLSVPFKKTGTVSVPYKATVTVGSGKDYETIGEAIEAIRNMNRTDDQRVTVEIQPGDYQEMLVIDTPNVTLKNAVSGASIQPVNKGVSLDANSVRITGYYGHGYTYYSMGDDCKYDARLLEVNKYNGYASFVNPGSGTTAGSYWNATVVINAAGFEAKDIIFENSFNQYQSEKAAGDVIVKQSGAKEGSVARSSMQAGDTTVQDKKYVERAAAIAIRSAATKAYFDHCAFIGRQDTLYGDVGSTQAFYNCDVYGGTDYIFGGMTAVFAKCDLVFNTSEDKNDVGYITAAQQKSATGRGYLMYNCTVKSTTPGVNTASQHASKPGQFGRPWQANTSEVVFFDTVVEATNWVNGVYDANAKTSLIQPAGWNAALGGESARCVEFGTYEVAGVNNSAARVNWAQQPETAVCADGTAISVAAFLGDWDPFAAHGNDMTIAFPDGTSQESPTPAPAAGTESESATTEFVFEASDLEAFAANKKADGDTLKAGTEDYFTLIFSAKSKVDSSSKKWEDGYTSGVRLNLGGKVTTDMNAIKFATSSEASVKIWWVEGGDDNRQMAILDSEGKQVAITEGEHTKNTAYCDTLKLDKAGTYYLGGATNNNYIFKVEVTDGAPTEVVRADWETVNEPVVTNVALNAQDPNKIDVTVSAIIGKDGGDKLTAYMLTGYPELGEREILATLQASAEKNEFVFSFTPTASGEYFFAASLSREDEEQTLESTETEKFAFSLPLTVPQIKNLVNKGDGEVAFKFYSVAEAESYQITVTDKADQNSVITRTFTPEVVVNNTKTEYEQRFTGLAVGHTYQFSVAAVRGESSSIASNSEIPVTEEGEIEWTFAAFGQGVDKNSKNTGYKKNAEDSVTVWNLNSKGKLVPASTDGLAFYYATLPSDVNFTLTAKATIDTWAFTNGQEGFGLMACDRVGVNGDASVFWNNSYMASGTKVEYYYDTIGGSVTTDSNAAKISMKLGLGAQEKVGVTKENLSLLEANDSATVNADFKSKMYPLESSCGSKGAGTYNLFANNSSGTVQGTIENPLTEVVFRIQKNNTGYFVSLLDENGNEVSTKKFYDTEALSKLDEEHVYVGFFASRTFKVTFSDIELVTINPADDAPSEGRPITYVVPNYSIISAEHSNTADYTLQYYGNANGTLKITDATGKVLVDNKAVKSGKTVDVKTVLSLGENRFNVTFTPEAGFHPGNDQYQLLESYETANFSYTVTYKNISAADEIFVAPTGTANGAGTEADPVDIYTAVKFVKPGQTIRLAGGTYSLQETVTVARGIDGTAENPIRMIADPDNRAVFDFNKKCAGFVIAGDYWYISGIDCTHSGNSLKGIQLSGSHCTLKDIHTYENGNTGIQVSRYLGSDKSDKWPSYDLILNCTSYSNADAGYEDADGFAAKLTVGNGIVFDGCIAYNNADDGWDLFAKVETGSIGQVTIQNCVAFSNGYGVDGTNEGNGNGFKMGGSSITGHHKLINSVAFNNKAKGIDSNSCPDIEVYNSTSFNNGANNVALYTNDAANTAFMVDGVMSFRTENTGNAENLKLKGTQNSSMVRGDLNFYWEDGKSANKAGLTASENWFVSLNAPGASVSDPLQVAEDMRTEDGRIDLGNFLKMSDTGIAALEAAGIDYKDVLAILDGNYDALTDQSQIKGSAADSKDGEPKTEEPTTEVVQPAPSQNESTQTTPAQTVSQNTAEAAPSTQAAEAKTEEKQETATQKTETTTEETAVETHELGDTEAAGSGSNLGGGEDLITVDIAPSPEPAKKFPVVPVAAGTGAVVVIAVAAVVAIKTGLMAKILAALGLIK